MFFQNHASVWVGHSNLLSQISWLSHGISTRKGGCSRPPYSTLNLALNTNDNPSDVMQNRTRFFQAIHASSEICCEANQVHGNRVKIVNHADSYDDVDGLITAQPGLMLTIRTADCVPVFIVDVKQKMIALVHAGWRGTAGRIGRRAVQIFEKEFNSHTSDLRAWIGPSIGPCCYEVGDEVKSVVDAAYIQQSKFDLRRYNADQLIEAGLEPRHVDKAAHCTVCQNNSFFSHRAEQGRTGRMLSYLLIRSG